MSRFFRDPGGVARLPPSLFSLLDGLDPACAFRALHICIRIADSMYRRPTSLECRPVIPTTYGVLHQNFQGWIERLNWAQKYELADSAVVIPHADYMWHHYVPCFLFRSQSSVMPSLLRISFWFVVWTCCLADWLVQVCIVILGNGCRLTHHLFIECLQRAFKLMVEQKLSDDVQRQQVDFSWTSRHQFNLIHLCFGKNIVVRVHLTKYSKIKHPTILDMFTSNPNSKISTVPTI
jgi:hypothetical protein